MDVAEATTAAFVTFEPMPVGLASRDSAWVLVGSTEGEVEVPVPVSMAAVGVSIEKVYEAMLARSLITDAEPTVKTLESSLQHVLPSE